MAISPSTRFEVLKRDNFTCQYCGEKAPDMKVHVDHLIPKSKGGNDSLSNLVTACGPCNVGKASRLLPPEIVLEKRKKQAFLNRQIEYHRQAKLSEKQKDEENAIDVWKHYAKDVRFSEDIIKDTLRRYSFDTCMDGMQLAVNLYFEYQQDHPKEATPESIQLALSKLRIMCHEIELQNLDNSL